MLADYAADNLWPAKPPKIYTHGRVDGAVSHNDRSASASAVDNSSVNYCAVTTARHSSNSWTRNDYQCVAETDRQTPMVMVCQIYLHAVALYSRPARRYIWQTMRACIWVQYAITGVLLLYWCHRNLSRVINYVSCVVPMAHVISVRGYLRPRMDAPYRTWTGLIRSTYPDELNGRITNTCINWKPRGHTFSGVNPPTLQRENLICV